MWYNHQNAERGLNPKVHRTYNTPLKGLFWLAKDLYEKERGFTEAIEPDAQEIAEIRNHIEHKYLKLQVYDPPQPQSTNETDRFGFEPLAFSLDRKEFDRRTLRLLHMVRAVLIQLSQAVHVEEHQHHVGAESQGQTAPIYLDRYEDDWKF